MEATGNSAFLMSLTPLNGAHDEDQPEIDGASLAKNSDVTLKLKNGQKRLIILPETSKEYEVCFKNSKIGIVVEPAWFIMPEKIIYLEDSNTEEYQQEREVLKAMVLSDRLHEANAVSTFKSVKDSAFISIYRELKRTSPEQAKLRLSGLDQKKFESILKYSDDEAVLELTNDLLATDEKWKAGGEIKAEQKPHYKVYVAALESKFGNDPVKLQQLFDKLKDKPALPIIAVHLSGRCQNKLLPHLSERTIIKIFNAYPRLIPQLLKNCPALSLSSTQNQQSKKLEAVIKDCSVCALAQVIRANLPKNSEWCHSTLYAHVETADLFSELLASASESERDTLKAPFIQDLLKDTATAQKVVLRLCEQKEFDSLNTLLECTTRAEQLVLFRQSSSLPLCEAIEHKNIQDEGFILECLEYQKSGTSLISVSFDKRDENFSRLLIYLPLSVAVEIINNGDISPGNLGNFLVENVECPPTKLLNILNAINGEKLYRIFESIGAEDSKEYFSHLSKQQKTNFLKAALNKIEEDQHAKTSTKSFGKVKEEQVLLAALEQSELTALAFELPHKEQAKFCEFLDSSGDSRSISKVLENAKREDKLIELLIELPEKIITKYQGTLLITKEVVIKLTNGANPEQVAKLLNSLPLERRLEVFKQTTNKEFFIECLTKMSIDKAAEVIEHLTGDEYKAKIVSEDSWAKAVSTMDKYSFLKICPDISSRSITLCLKYFDVNKRAEYLTSFRETMSEKANEVFKRLYKIDKGILDTSLELNSKAINRILVHFSNEIILNLCVHHSALDIVDIINLHSNKEVATNLLLDALKNPHFKGKLAKVNGTIALKAFKKLESGEQKTQLLEELHGAPEKFYYFIDSNHYETMELIPYFTEEMLSSQLKSKATSTTLLFYIYKKADEILNDRQVEIFYSSLTAEQINDLSQRLPTEDSEEFITLVKSKGNKTNVEEYLKGTTVD
ncbi:hypothetical protein SOPP22_16210 [Shewanella sp. OPT22]|nr:hypothetical protein SOPP22_16210 [Shewanella sp. OPT22]